MSGFNWSCWCPYDTHEATFSLDGGLIFLVSSKGIGFFNHIHVLWPAFSYMGFLNWNCLFRLTSNGWSLLVQPPGMASGTVVISLNFYLTAGVKWATNASRTRNVLWPSVAGSHTRSIHSSIKLSFIQAFLALLRKHRLLWCWVAAFL